VWSELDVPAKERRPLRRSATVCSGDIDSQLINEICQLSELSSHSFDISRQRWTIPHHTPTRSNHPRKAQLKKPLYPSTVHYEILKLKSDVVDSVNKTYIILPVAVNVVL